MIDIKTLIRPHLKTLVPYSSARDEYNGSGNIWLDANENPFPYIYNRYPDPKQNQLKSIVAKWRNVESSQVFIGNGSDEIIDLLFRAFCEPGRDKAYGFTPTYGMYKVSAHINKVDWAELKLDKTFGLPELNEIRKHTKDAKGLMFICSPNNPTGNVYGLDEVRQITSMFNGLVVIDEAYIDFSDSVSAVTLIDQIPNLVVLQTFSKAFGLSGLRVGLGFANPEIIQVLNTIKPPYNVNTYSQRKAIEVLSNTKAVEEEVEYIKSEREYMRNALGNQKGVIHIYPSEANFLLVEFESGVNQVYNKLKDKGIIVRNRHTEIENCLRITIGTKAENRELIKTLKEIL